ncbi:hypothetical protein L3Y19_gp054 [Gordonia phage Neville]|uniref:Uncharacterized protein n=2 Tax=Nevillevirus TaxID=3044773 RepID=A0A515MH07_9CAUD|nr:hypothetical protein L3Y19_gp054 [Gordonia phage Neville]YP_010246038.1 hypothetical protein L3Y20_gp053 [Gordonia phage Trax]AXQ64423.1 hypothetical protein SEA_NEVILLE_54 [Gordonia phage Neville]QDM55940.1 hypothetical protein SEA_TRAX_53 [Gordonia phage Trax]
MVLKAAERLPMTPELEAKLVASVVELATANPEFVYEAPAGGAACLYTHKDEPSCLIGQALSKVGYTIEELYEFDHNEMRESDAGWILTELGASDEVALWALGVQTRQDDQVAWGNALWYTDEECGRPEVKVA